MKRNIRTSTACCRVCTLHITLHIITILEIEYGLEVVFEYLTGRGIHHSHRVGMIIHMRRYMLDLLDSRSSLTPNAWAKIQFKELNLFLHCTTVAAESRVH